MTDDYFSSLESLIRTIYEADPRAAISTVWYELMELRILVDADTTPDCAEANIVRESVREWFNGHNVTDTMSRTQPRRLATSKVTL